MSWSIGYDSSWNRDIGYGVVAFCDHPKCSAEIDRGLAFVCGGEPYGGERGCGLYFCGKHLKGGGQLCPRCAAYRAPYKRPKSEHPRWIRHKLRDASWARWREENSGRGRRATGSRPPRPLSGQRAMTAPTQVRERPPVTPMDSGERAGLCVGSLFSGVGGLTCEVCGQAFRSHNPNPRFCSITCKGVSQRKPLDATTLRALYLEQGLSQEEVAERLGVSQQFVGRELRRLDLPARRAAKRDQSGERNHMWKGDRAGYAAFHKRVEQGRGKPCRCDSCGTGDPDLTYDWANLSGAYDDPADYARMCRSCHHRFDGRGANFGGGR